MRVRVLVALFCIFAFPSHSLLAWNATGHRAITFLAWSSISTRAKERINAILRAHPDYASILNKGPAKDPVDIARNVFSAASTWPDIIKGDPRFFDTVVPGSMPLPGFPDMQRHQSWHYINVPYPQEFQSQAIDPENALAQIKTLLKTLRRDGPVTQQEAYALPWILHLVTDVHQPLHTIAKFRSVGGRAEQDKGGNACYLADDRNLHAFWDGILGTNFDDAPVARLAASIEDHLPRPKRLDLRPETWIREGLELAEPVVYRFEGACDDRDRPLRLSAEYKVVARRIAFGRAAMAAYRLAELLNEKLGE